MKRHKGHCSYCDSEVLFSAISLTLVGKSYLTTYCVCSYQSPNCRQSMAFPPMPPNIYCYLQVDKDKALLQKPLSLEFSSFTFSWILAFLKMSIRTTSNSSLMCARSCHLCGVCQSSKAGYTRGRSSSKKCILIISTRSQTMLLTALLLSWVREMNQLPNFGGRDLANYYVSFAQVLQLSANLSNPEPCTIFISSGRSSKLHAIDWGWLTQQASKKHFQSIQIK